jgi:exoribonuclease-2
MIGVGKLIEYLDGGKFICALVLDSQDKRLRLLNQNGRELNLPLSRVVFSSERSYRLEDNREIAIRLLRDAAERRCSFMQRIELKEIWDLVTEEANETFSPDFLAELVFGEEVDDDIISAFIRCVFEDKLFFKYKEGQIRVTSPDKVDILRAQLAKEAQKNQIVDLGVRTVNDVQANKLQATNLTENEENVLNLIRDYYLFGSDAPEAELAQKILRATNLTKPHDPYYLLVKSGLWSPNENIPLLRNQLPVNFSLAARQQAEHLLQSGLRTVLEEKGRVDFTHLHPITIDGPTTLDFDDALSVEMEGDNYLVGIHISDVSHYVRPGDPLFTEAMRRGTSIYFPEGQIPMLPRHLSQGICSLIQDELRATVSFMLLLSPEGEVLRVRIYPSIIKVKRRLTYDEVDQMLESDEEIRTLNMLRKKLRQRRLENGALLLPFPDINIFIDNHGKVHVTLAQSDTPARTIVSEMMILANSEAAKYIANRMVPGLFRSQPPLQQRLVYGEDDDLFQNTLQRKQMPRGELSTVAKPHSGLGVSHYSTVTSPIRRLLDLVMQHQLKSTINRQEPCFTEEMCKDFSSILTRTLTLANNVRQQRQRYWLLKYLAERKGSYLDALVIQAGPKRVNLLLTDILMDIDLPTPGGRPIHPNTIVKVKIVKADPLDNVVRFDW